MDRGQYQEAVKVCRLGLLAHPTDIDGRLILGTSLMALRRYDEVLAEMYVALEIEATHPRALMLRGEALLRKGDAVQAAELLDKAYSYDPSDPSIRALRAEAAATADRGPAGGAAFGVESPDFMTKHYPAHRGLGAGAGSVTRPTNGLAPRGATPSPAVLAVGDRSGTIELDPDLEGIEILEDELDPPADPPLPMGETSDVIELESFDLLEEDEPVPAEQSVPQYQAVSEPAGATVQYRRPDRAAAPVPSVVPETPAVLASRHNAAAVVPSRAVAAAPSRVIADSAARIADMFPEDESGVSKLAELPGEVPAPSSLDPRAMPPRRAMSDDMRTIRAGIDGVPAHGSFQQQVRTEGVRPLPSPGPRADETEHVPRSSRKSTATTPAHGAKRRSRRGRPRRVASAAKRRRGGVSRVAYVSYFLIAASVVGGAVFAGFKIRDVRLQREERAARTRAVERAGADSYHGYLQARSIYEGIVGARNTRANRAALARVTAAIAAEFGDGTIITKGRDVSILDEAKRRVDGIGDDRSADGIASRAYLALAMRDPAAAERHAKELVRLFPKEPHGAYLRGRAELMEGRYKAAESSFLAALSGGQRPRFYVGLGKARAGAGKLRLAVEAFNLALNTRPGHPSAIIEKARVLAQAPTLLAEDKTVESSLAALIAEGRRDLAKQELGVSRDQVAWASLARVEVALARGDKTAAASAVAELKKQRRAGSWEFTRALAQVFLRTGDVKAARAAAESAAKRWPTQVGARVLLADVAMRHSKPRRALDALKAAGDLSQNAEALALRGRAHLALGTLDEATRDLDAALALRPTLRAAQVARAELDLHAGRAKAVVTRLEALYTDDAAADLAVVYASALRRVGKFAKARRILDRLKGGAFAGRAYLELARLERDEGRFRSARKAFGKAIELQPDAVVARLEAALLGLDTGDPLGARETLTALAKEAPDNGAVVIEAARVHTLTGQVAEGKAMVDRAEKLPSAPRWKVARERGRGLIRSRATKAAITELERAISLRPSDGETRILLIDAYLISEDGDGARRAKSEVVKRFPGTPIAQMAVGRIELFFENYGAALTAFKRARRFYQRRKAPPRLLATATYWIGQTLYYDGKLVAAARELRRTVKLDPGHANAYYFLGLVELERPRRVVAAVKALQKSVKIDPLSNPDAWYYLGEASYKSSRWIGAQKALRKYLSQVKKDGFTVEARKMLRSLK